MNPVSLITVIKCELSQKNKIIIIMIYFGRKCLVRVEYNSRYNVLQESLREMRSLLKKLRWSFTTTLSVREDRACSSFFPQSHINLQAAGETCKLKARITLLAIYHD